MDVKQLILAQPIAQANQQPLWFAQAAIDKRRGQCCVPYTVTYENMDKSIARVVVTCPNCKARGEAEIDAELASKARLYRPGSANSLAVIGAILAAASNAH